MISDSKMLILNHPGMDSLPQTDSAILHELSPHSTNFLPGL